MMNASEYTKMSKEIGWAQRPPEPLPTKERALELARLAAAGDRAAYKQIFTIHRYASTPQTDEGLEIIHIIFDAWAENRSLFEHQL